MRAIRGLARYLSRRRWLAKISSRLVVVDIALQRLSRGRIAFGRIAGLTAVLLTTTGRRSGQPRVVPLIAVPEGDSLLLVASNWGGKHHPAWSANLIAEPNATAEVLGHPFPVTATLLTGEARELAWATATRAWPAYTDYATRSGREIRIFRVTRRDGRV